MKIQDAMSESVEYLDPKSSLQDAAQRMRELDCGFLPVRDKSGDKLEGVVTDRDIVVRAIAEGLNPAETSIEKAMSDRVLYCYESDDLESAALSMQKLQVYRLVVLNNPEEKRLRGIVTLGDILRKDQKVLASETAREITDKVA